jgi:hypothetical protein
MRETRGPGFKSHAPQERFPGFKLFFISSMDFSPGCVGKTGIKGCSQSGLKPIYLFLSRAWTLVPVVLGKPGLKVVPNRD